MVKLSLYAQTGIREVWLVELAEERIEVYRQPGPQGYQEVQRLWRGQRVASQGFPDLELAVDVGGSVLARRAHEQGRSREFQSLLNAVVSRVPTEAITWLSAETERWYEQVIALVRNTSGPKEQRSRGAGVQRCRGDLLSRGDI